MNNRYYEPCPCTAVELSVMTIMLSLLFLLLTIILSKQKGTKACQSTRLLILSELSALVPFTRARGTAAAVTIS